MGTLIQQGQSLSIWPVSGSHNENNTAFFQDICDLRSKRSIRVQGFYWNGSATLTVVDSNSVVLFNGGSTSPAIWPSTASGSYGLITTAPLFMSTSGLAGGGGTLIVYGEVL